MHLQDLGHVADVVDGAPRDRERGQPGRPPRHAQHVAHAVRIPVVALACRRGRNTAHVRGVYT